MFQGVEIFQPSSEWRGKVPTSTVPRYQDTQRSKRISFFLATIYFCSSRNFFNKLIRST